ncbi:MAG: 4-hydroxy-tetrahydrodipicolinate reductase [Oscillospiraceae bacterium]|nr:4-hydroxy-tetrahydrodipicolinate reductase [Oscillospiraceae bacterium]RKJ58280.1 4-hydroxy-tetrahydrodipicolinate reductase [bacterium 1XD42-8]RKJ66888.1 4-hydroxy-tetrahydrodipicolinate reductase [bacterium 1XD42-1]
MKRIILSGCCGKMGHMISDCIKERNDCTLVAGIDITGTAYDAFPVFTSPSECSVEADVMIDFSHPSALESLLSYARTQKLPTVIATTGLSQDQIKQIEETAQYIPLFFSFNMSLGINLLCELAKKAAAVLDGQFDIEIVEKHHNRKLDAPSGTALMLADEVSSVLKEQPRYVYDRHSVRQKRGKEEIGIHSIRGGTIVGEHEVIFAGRDEIITLSHTAMSREVFATGSVNAALFLCEKENGLYNMGDLV